MLAYQALTTLNQLDVIEAERDQWQRPSEVIQALDLKDGDSVVDLGCGSGYFSLKLSDPIGRNGKVIAEDIRRLSLTFLWMRTVRKGKHNLSMHLGDLDDPRLRPSSINAVLISNTYHEFTAAQSILDHVSANPWSPAADSSLSTARQKACRSRPAPSMSTRFLLGRSQQT